MTCFNFFSQKVRRPFDFATFSVHTFDISIIEITDFKDLQHTILNGCWTNERLTQYIDCVSLRLKRAPTLDARVLIEVVRWNFYFQRFFLLLGVFFNIEYGIILIRRVSTSSKRVPSTFGWHPVPFLYPLSLDIAGLDRIPWDLSIRWLLYLRVLKMAYPSRTPSMKAIKPASTSSRMGRSLWISCRHPV